MSFQKGGFSATFSAVFKKSTSILDPNSRYRCWKGDFPAKKAPFRPCIADYSAEMAPFQLKPCLRIPGRCAKRDARTARMRCAAWTSLIDMNRVEELVSPGDAKCCAQSQLRQLTISPLSLRPRLGIYHNCHMKFISLEISANVHKLKGRSTKIRPPACLRINPIK